MKRKLKVLILTGNPADASLVLVELEKKWQEIKYELADTADKMTELLNCKKWDIIISKNIITSNFTGLDGLKNLSESKLDIPFIMISSVLGEHIAVSAIKAGAQDYILKDNLCRLVPIVERELAEKEIRQRDKQIKLAYCKFLGRYELVFDSESSIALYERNDRERYFTDNIRYLTGWDSEDLVAGKPLYEQLVEAQYKPVIRMKYQKWSHTGKNGLLYLWYQIKHRNGKILWIEERMSQTIDSIGVEITTGILIDNTKLKIAERKLWVSKQKFISYIEHAPFGIFVNDEQGNNLEVNSTASIITGYSSKELLSMNLFDLLPQQALKSGREHFDRVIKKGLASNENQFKHKSGEIRYWTIDSVRLSSTRFVEYVQDISERKRGKEKLSKTIAKLESTQEKMVQMETMAALGEFSSGIAHEIRNPLANIYSSVQYIMKKFQPDKEMTVFLELINRNSENANFIIKELLEFAKPQTLILEPNDILKVLDNICELTSAKRIENNIELVKIYSSKLPKIALDIGTMNRAVLNIVMNAIEAMSHGGRLTIKAVSGNNIIVVYISDTGRGITKKDINKIFNPFFSRKKTGFGLGLSITHQIIALHSGTIDVKSQYNKGSTFIIQLPIDKDSVQ